MIAHITLFTAAAIFMVPGLWYAKIAVAAQLVVPGLVAWAVLHMRERLLPVAPPPRGESGGQRCG